MYVCMYVYMYIYIYIHITRVQPPLGGHGAAGVLGTVDSQTPLLLQSEMRT